MENKIEICNQLCKVLQLTRGAHDLVSLDFDQEVEVVIAVFGSGNKKGINVAMDSGTAMIRDIVNHLGC